MTRTARTIAAAITAALALALTPTGAQAATRHARPDPTPRAACVHYLPRLNGPEIRVRKCPTARSPRTSSLVARRAATYRKIHPPTPCIPGTPRYGLCLRAQNPPRIIVDPFPGTGPARVIVPPSRGWPQLPGHGPVLR